MKHVKRILSVLLAALMIFGVMPFGAFAVSENTPKEEVIYINLNADGSVKEINVVNIFELDEDGQIIDYGKYESLRNMTTTDKIGYSGETVTIDAKKGKLYYEGKLQSNVMPWNIAIKYFMDGKEYSAADIAGKSGALKITIQITENTQCIGNFFEGYALQASVTLDTKKCRDITADGATVANVGSKKQLTYTILPNKGADVEITAQVTDFEMQSIAINGIKLNLAIKIDESVISEKIDALTGGIKDLNDGAGKLNDGAKELYDGTSLLKDKVGELYTGVGALNGGSGKLSSGLSEIASKNNELLNGAYAAFKGICSASETMLNAELTKNGLQPVKLTPETYSAVLSQLLTSMDADNVYTTVYNIALAEVTAQVEAQADAVYAGYIEQNADEIYSTYIHSQAEAIYVQVATQIVLEQLITSGYTEDDALAYLKTEEGQDLIALAVSFINESQKQQIIAGALASLTDDQKAQIRAGAVKSLTEDQKKQIRDGFIEQTMKSKEVTDKITAGVAAAGSATASIAGLKGQLDNFSLFYNGLKEYTSAVTTAANGAKELKINMDTLYTNVGTLKTAVGDLNAGVKELFDGTTELKNGTDTFVNETDGVDTEVSSIVDSVVSSISGGDVEIKSFVSEKNTNVNAVQFVIQTEAVQMAEAAADEPAPAEELNFWQKLLRLFGLY